MKKGSYVERRNKDATLKADVREYTMQERIGDVPPPEIRAVLKLARAFQVEEGGPDYATSWANQERAQDYFNAHGLGATLDELFKREKG